MHQKLISSKLIILMPYLDDQPSLEILIPALLINVKEFHLVVIDDGSVQHPLNQKDFHLLHPNATLLKLKRNSGFQRAIALGLLYIEDNFHYEHVLIMDSDGGITVIATKLASFSDHVARIQDVVSFSNWKNYGFWKFFFTLKKSRTTPHPLSADLDTFGLELPFIEITN